VAQFKTPLPAYSGATVQDFHLVPSLSFALRGKRTQRLVSIIFLTLFIALSIIHLNIPENNPKNKYGTLWKSPYDI